jgi:hypothetical protein
VWRLRSAVHAISKISEFFNGLLAFFQPNAADNLRTIRDLMKSVAKEVGTADLAAVEAEIDTTDNAINKLVY